MAIQITPTHLQMISNKNCKLLKCVFNTVGSLTVVNIVYTEKIKCFKYVQHEVCAKITRQLVQRIKKPKYNILILNRYCQQQILIASTVARRVNKSVYVNIVLSAVQNNTWFPI